MFFTRLNSTARAWKSSDARIALERFGHAAGAQRADVARGRGRADDSAGEAARLEREAHALDRKGQRGLRAPRRSTDPSSPARERARASSGPSQTSRSMPVSSGRSIRIRTAPCVCRRSPNGSREPVARSPARDKRHERVQLVGERHRRPRDRRGAELLARRRRIRLDADRQVLVIDRLPDLLGQPFLARVDARPSCPAARGTRTPCRS